MIREIDLRGAVAINVITMVGIGPLITIPLVLADLHGAQAIVAWIAGAVIALCDGLAWAELGSLFPRSGGTYGFLREGFGRERWGRLFGFLFAWQIVLSAPLVLASGYIGFAHYAGYLYAPLGADTLLQGNVAALVGVVTLAALYRPIRSVGRIGIGLAGVAIATLCAVIVAAATHFDPARALTSDTGGMAALAGGLGPALVITLYDYYGYGQSCTIGDEVRDTKRVLPRSVIVSIVGIAVLYVALQLGVLGVVSWHELVPPPNGALPDAANYVASTVVERTLGTWPARVVTIAILVTAFASTFGNLLGYSRIPYAAAQDGVFLTWFARLDARGRFPNVALVTIGLLALPACYLSLGDVINALVAGIVIVQGILQLVAVVAVRARGVRAPYRMMLYPLPLIVALLGWSYIFFSSGVKAIVFGCVSLGVGCAIYLLRAARAREWPFPVPRAALVLITLAGVACAVSGADAAPLPAATPSWGHARIALRDGDPVFEVDRKPFFVYGAAFFYERLPRDMWRTSMAALRTAGINTLDLYVPWNWHELADGDFDFDGRTNPRRDFDEVLRLARAFDFKLIVRPGPVIRNEWRNGGYPAWLLARPDYGMPLHDLLEGRYPPTATLQNAHSDDAAAEWMRNKTHMTYAKRWLERVLRECSPDADRIVAIALDDDQGAYIDNQTYPAPHLVRYLTWLRDIVHGVTGPLEPTFINTYQMKVTSSSPVWAMGNWYQSDAFAIGEHDRAQLEFSTGLLHTRPDQPMMASEFQAGWLEGPGDVRPRPADPSNTSLALGTMIAMGVRGVVNFPAQDTLNPSGWEAPFSNAFYAWDAAFSLDAIPTPRDVPTAAYGALVARYGSALAASRVRYDAAIAYAGASIAPNLAINEYFSAVETQTIAAQRACRDAGLTCALVDPSTSTARELARYPVVLAPLPAGYENDERPDIRATYAAYTANGGSVVRDPSAAALARAFFRTGRRAAVEGVRDATFASDETHEVAGFLTVVNYDDAERRVVAASVAVDGGDRRAVPPFVVPARSARVIVIGGPSDAGPPAVRDASPPAIPPSTPCEGTSVVPIRSDSALPCAAFARIAPGTATAYLADVYRDGSEAVVLDNGIVRVVVAPDAGARAFVFEDDATQRNVFTSVGAMRDDVAIEPPLSTTDRIARYTHDFQAGTFNRPYSASTENAAGIARATLRYDAPDVVPHGASFVRDVSLAPDARSFDLVETANVRDVAADEAQRAVSVTSLSVGDGADMTTRRLLIPQDVPFVADTTARVASGNAFGFYDTKTHELATIAWRESDVAEVAILERRFSIVARLTLAAHAAAHVRFGYVIVRNVSDARAALAAADRSAQGLAPTERKTALAGKWRNGLRDRLKSD